MLFLDVKSSVINFSESRTSLVALFKVVLNSVSWFLGSYCGEPIWVEKFTNIGTLIPVRSGKNLPNSTFPDKSNRVLSSLFRSLTRRSLEPKPMVLLLPEIVISAKSANLAFNLAVAAQPPRSSKSVNRSSLNQISADLSKPSSKPGVAKFLKGLRTPNI